MVPPLVRRGNRWVQSLLTVVPWMSSPSIPVMIVNVRARRHWIGHPARASPCVDWWPFVAVSLPVRPMRWGVL